MYFYNQETGEVLTERLFLAEAEDIIEQELEDGGLDELLNEIYPAIEIGYLRYEAADVLKRMDEPAYREALTNEVSYQLDNLEEMIGQSISGEIYYGHVLYETMDELQEEEFDEAQ